MILSLKQRALENLLNEETELLISQLKKLNRQFSESIGNDQDFDNSKKIYMKIKAANVKLTEYINEERRNDIPEISLS